MYSLFLCGIAWGTERDNVLMELLGDKFEK